MEYLLLLVGFVLLVKGADFFVEGSSSLAKIMKVPSVIIGLTIVAMGTSAPEASVSINAALTGNNDIAISNVVGSNIFNGLVVVGICAFLASFKTNLDILKRDMPLNILVTFILCIMFLDGKLSRIEGGILLAGMILYIAVMICHAIKNKSENEPEKILSLPRSIIYMIAGLAAVIFGGDLVVDKACIIATNFGAGKGGRIRQVLRLALGTSAFFGVFWTALSVACPNLYIRIFMSPTETILAMAPAIIRAYAISFLLLPFNIFSTYYFQAILQPKAAFIVSVARGLVISGALILMLPLLAGADSLWFAMPITELVTAVYAAACIRRYTARLDAKAA